MKWVVISVRMFAVLSGIFLLMYDTVDVVDRFLPATYATYATAYAKGMHVLLVLLGAGLILGGILGRRILPAADLIGVGSCHPEPWKMGWNHAWQIAALLTLLSLGLRGYGLNRSMQIDEVFLFKSMVTQSPVKIFLHPSGSAHLLQTLLANLLVRLLGEHVWVARLPALLFGSLTPALLYLMVRRWFGTCAALCASVFLVFSPLHIWYSQEAKGNVLLVFFVVLSWWALQRLVDRSGRVYAFIYAAALLGGALSHLSGAFVILGQGLAVAWISVAQRHPARMRVVLQGLLLHLYAGYAALLVYAPVLFFLLKQKETVSGKEGPSTVVGMLRGIGSLYFVLDGSALVMLGVALLALAGVVVLVVRKRSCRLLALWFAPGICALLVTVLAGSFSHARYYFMILPSMAGLVGVGGGWILEQAARWGGRWRVAVAGGMAIIFGMCVAEPLSTFYRQEKSNYRAVAAWVARVGTSTPVYVVSSGRGGYPALGYDMYADRFMTDAGIATLEPAESVLVVVLDPLHLKASYPVLHRMLDGRPPVAAFRCLGELDQYRVRDSYIYECQAEALQ